MGRTCRDRRMQAIRSHILPSYGVHRPSPTWSRLVEQRQAAAPSRSCAGAAKQQRRSGGVFRLDAATCTFQCPGQPARLRLPDEALARFNEDGVVVIDNLVDAAAVQQLKQRATQIAMAAANAPGETIGPITVQVEPAVLSGEVPNQGHFVDSVRKLAHIAFHDSIFEAHARRPAILDVVEALLDTPDLKLYQDQLFMKPARVGSRQKVHQDQPLGFHIEPTDRMVTAWLALDPSATSTGAVRMMPGSHRRGVLTEEEKQAAEAASLMGQAEEWPIELAPGSVSFHHGHLLHSSTANESPVSRRGLATHYVSAHCRFTGNPDANDAMLVRGVSMPGHI